MANTKSAIKRIRRIAKQTAVNKARRSRYKNALKKMNSLIETKKKSGPGLITANMCRTTTVKNSVILKLVLFPI